MPSKDIILIGGGGHCKSCIDVIESAGRFNIAGILDVEEKLTEKILGYPVIGVDADIPKFAKQGHSFIITAGHIKSSAVRRKLFELVKSADGVFETVVASTARVSKFARIGEGSFIMHFAMVNADAFIGNNCIINSHALVEHDAQVNDHVHLSTMSVINGGCIIGEGSFIGSNAVVNQGIRVGDDVIIGAGTVVHREIHIPGTYAGNPFKKLIK